MIERLIIRNFQKHDLFKIDLDPGITCLVGPSDSGKSSIFRALRWVCLNQPSGEAFIKQGSESTKVKVIVDGISITRDRGQGRNNYVCGKRVFSALGIGGIPDDIERVLNLSDLNFQGQHENAFWVSKSPGEVSRELNQVINLGLIDSTLANIASELRKARSESEISEKRLNLAKEKYKELDWIEQANEDLEEIEDIEKELLILAINTSRILDLLSEVQDYEKQIHRWETTKQAIQKDIAKIEKVKSRYEILHRENMRLQWLIDQIQEMECIVGKLSKDASEAEKVLNRQMSGILCPICKKLM